MSPTLPYAKLDPSKVNICIYTLLSIPHHPHPLEGTTHPNRFLPLRNQVGSRSSGWGMRGAPLSITVGPRRGDQTPTLNFSVVGPVSMVSFDSYQEFFSSCSITSVGRRAAVGVPVFLVTRPTPITDWNIHVVAVTQHAVPTERRSVLCRERLHFDSRTRTHVPLIEAFVSPR